MLAAAVTLGATAVVYVLRGPSNPPARPRVLPVTAYGGNAILPTFSPDGTQVAFAWNGEKQDNYEIYVKLVDGGTPLRLTNQPGDNVYPKWSPDGRWIAFLRGDAVYLIPPIGGPERKLAEQVNSVDWMPDSRSLVVGYAPDRQQGGIGVTGVDNGETRRLTTAPGRGMDAQPAVSPDGRSLAFNRLTGSRFDIYVTPIAGGEPRRLPKTAGSSGG